MRMSYLRSGGSCLQDIAIAAAIACLVGPPVRAHDGLQVEGQDLPYQITEPVSDKASFSADQESAKSNDQGQNHQQSELKPENKDDRMFFVMPNFLTVDNETKVMPLTWRSKFSISVKGAFDPYEFAIVGVLAGIRQAENTYPGFGQGFEGYGKRYGAGLADQVDGNIMVGAVFPSILRTDPRYFRLGKGRFVRRFGYAISRIFVTRTDSGRSAFNFSEFAGNGVAIGISNFYYPAADRGFSTSLDNWATQLSIDALGNELKEFWPDIHRRLTKKNQTDAQTK
jgi:hypothetical protein